MRRHDEGTRAARLGRHALVLSLIGLASARAGAAPPVDDSAEGAPEAAPPDSEVAPPNEAAPPSEPTTARDWYTRGIELATAGDFVAAAAAFLRSYELHPTPQALFNAGLAFENAGDPIAAIETYRKYLDEPDRDAELVRAAEAAIARLTQKVGTLKGVRYDPRRPPEELHVDGQPRELDELPLLVMPGSIEIEVVDAAGERARETYEIAAGEALVIDLRALLPVKPPQPPDTNLEVDVGPTPDELAALEAQRVRIKRLRTTTWIGLGLTGAAGISLATFAGLAVRERNAFLDATCYEFGGDCPDGFEPGDPERHLIAYERSRTGATVSAALVGGFALGSLVVGLISLRSQRQLGRQQVRLRPTPVGLRLEF